MFCSKNLKAKIRPDLTLQKSPQNRIEDICIKISKIKIYIEWAEFIGTQTKTYQISVHH